MTEPGRPPVRLEVADRIATITLDRPEARNALDSAALALLPRLLLEADGRDDVDVLVLTGADPAFCAGLDLKELGAGRLRAADTMGSSAEGSHGPIPALAKPLIGAVNGAAITGGFELALNCDFLIASDRARFADTHARVGVQPGWGLTVLLPRAIGVRRARELSFTGNFLTAQLAEQWGLVNRVVPHDELLPTVRAIAADIVSNDSTGVQTIRATYAAAASTTEREAWSVEAAAARAWQGAGIDRDGVAARREAVMERGRRQT